MEDFHTLTTGALARAAETTVPLIVKYCGLGLLPHRTASNGTRLFSASAINMVRQLKAERLAKRGKRSVAA